MPNLNKHLTFLGKNLFSGGPGEFKLNPLNEGRVGGISYARPYEGILDSKWCFHLSDGKFDDDMPFSTLEVKQLASMQIVKDGGWFYWLEDSNERH